MTWGSPGTGGWGSPAGLTTSTTPARQAVSVATSTSPTTDPNSYFSAITTAGTQMSIDVVNLTDTSADPDGWCTWEVTTLLNLLGNTISQASLLGKVGFEIEVNAVLDANVIVGCGVANSNGLTGNGAHFGVGLQGNGTVNNVRRYQKVGAAWNTNLGTGGTSAVRIGQMPTIGTADGDTMRGHGVRCLDASRVEVDSTAPNITQTNWSAFDRVWFGVGGAGVVGSATVVIDVRVELLDAL